MKGRREGGGGRGLCVGEVGSGVMEEGMGLGFRV
jgi:hypothetical protein